MSGNWFKTGFLMVAIMALFGAAEHPATAQMMIVNPLHDGGLAGLFSTHPPSGERIRRLLALASQPQRGLQLR